MTRRRRMAVVLAVAMAAATGGTASAGGAAGSTPTTVDSLRYYQASVFVDGGPGELVGAVGFRSVVKGEVTVDVFFGSEEPVSCPDGSEDVRTETVRTEDPFASRPGPMVFDVDPRLLTAHGEGVVDLVHSVVAGCGADEVTTVLPARHVSIDVTGTTELIRARMTGSASARNAFDRARVTSIARDGTGQAVIDGFVDADSDAAWLKYAVEHFVRRGTQPEVPDSVAPEGGLGAVGGASAFYEPESGLGVLFEDAIVAATVGPAPAKKMLLTASALGVTAVECADGEIGYRYRDTFGEVATPVQVSHRLDAADAAATAQLTEITYDECTGAESSRIVAAPVALDLVATGPPVRVRDTYYFSAPPQPTTRINGWSLRRPAAGTVRVGTFRESTDFGAISRASR
ncbi:hypothetical protein GA707_12340 [Nostocoides sp. F2B08]|uniref:hypothetical protein n=1 Tax=Nostocoides sp. F2B08 TaxID=2653936 RepID=UPI00126317A2|nr:hypothetical protein [Tetrasphaera sp. F2B08]KAB7744224.1 hypothetical protein GA707_12340 [Tetrasphaera sp. F2B08]